MKIIKYMFLILSLINIITIFSMEDCCNKYLVALDKCLDSIILGSDQEYFYNSWLNKALKNNNISETKKLIKLGANLNYQEKESGDFPLLIAFYNDNDSMGCFKLLINAKADINLQNWEGDSLLHKAIKYGRKNIVKLLINAKINLDLQNIEYETPLMLSIIHKNEDLSELLINSKTNINLKNRKGKTALILASENGQKRIIQKLIESKAEINLKDNDGNTALTIADKKNYKEIAILLMEEIKKNKKNLGLELINSIKKNNIDRVKELIKEGADINFRDDSYFKQTPLIIASDRGYKDIALLLINNDADIYLKDNIEEDEDGWSAFQWSNNNGHTEIFKLLVKATKIYDKIKTGNYSEIKNLATKISLGIYDDENNNPLHLAAKYNQKEIFKLILSIRPQLIHEKNNHEQTPIDINLFFFY